MGLRDGLCGEVGGLGPDRGKAGSKLRSGERGGALTLDGAVPEGVEATAKDGDITLTGSVRTVIEREAAEVMVAELTGVRRVKNDIQIRDLEQA